MIRKILFLFLCCFVVAFISTGAWIWLYFVSSSSGTGSVIVNIPKGTGVRGIGKLLADKGLLRNDIRFLALVYFYDLGKQLRAGEYEIAYGHLPYEVLQVLVRGEVVHHSVTIPEGLTLSQIADIFTNKGMVDKDTFLALAYDPSFADSLGIHEISLEGYLFPDTYLFTRDRFDEIFILKTMVKRFSEVSQALPWNKKEEWNRHQLITLASIVEKETGAAFERPVIARVFFNRLARKMPLQSDPTVIYGLKDYTGHLTKADLRKPTPYNTYTIKALPPGPICNPGKASLEAVLFPADSNALYFVSRNDGTHVFSRSLHEHNQAVNRYQKRKKKENK